MVENYSSRRTFTVWQYSVAHHGGILLRSSRPTDSDTRIDLHVGGVHGMMLRPSYRGITIRKGATDEVERVVALLGAGVFASGGLLHVIGEERMIGFIIGGPLECHEACVPDDAPSGFLHMPATN